MIKVLYVNHKAQQCGVYEFGKDIGLLLQTSKKYNITYFECDSFREFKKYFKSQKPDIIIYNYHPSTMSWILAERFGAPKSYYLNAIHIGTIHEVYQELADNANDEMFDYHIGPDPTLLLKNPIVYKTGRLLPSIIESKKNNSTIPIIGSFGFATPNKGFENIIKLVQNEFDEAIINLNIPFAKFGDLNGENAKMIANNCRKLLTKENIILNIEHDYLEKEDLLKYLSKNTVNLFLYDEVINRGISSATDWALASGKPIGISNSSLFRHLHNCHPSIKISENNLHSIIKNDILPIKHLYKEYSPSVVLWDYERILSDVVSKNSVKKKKRTLLNYMIKKTKRRFGLNYELPLDTNVWTKKEDDFKYIGLINKNTSYEPNKQGQIIYNRILDNEARNFYTPAITFFSENFPDLIKKKIPEANVQQAFVFDTAINLSLKFENPKILAVGAYEDTAAEGLKLLGYDIDFIDPILNYDIETFISKPTIEKESYDIIISTSVIEHVENDEKFIQDIAFLLKKGGYSILTCDYNDQYKNGDDIPAVDFRFYTQYDLIERLMKAITNCKLVDAPQWDCENPDFYLSDRYNYTFASLVFYKD